jgi:uncharacterized membrane protein
VCWWQLAGATSQLPSQLLSVFFPQLLSVLAVAVPVAVRCLSQSLSVLPVAVVLASIYDSKHNSNWHDCQYDSN